MATTTASFGHSYFALFEGLAKEGDDPNAVRAVLCDRPAHMASLWWCDEECMRCLHTHIAGLHDGVDCTEFLGVHGALRRVARHIILAGAVLQEAFVRPTGGLVHAVRGLHVLTAWHRHLATSNSTRHVCVQHNVDRTCASHRPSRLPRRGVRRRRLARQPVPRLLYIRQGVQVRNTTRVGVLLVHASHVRVSWSRQLRVRGVLPVRCGGDCATLPHPCNPRPERNVHRAPLVRRCGVHDLCGTNPARNALRRRGDCSQLAHAQSTSTYLYFGMFRLMSELSTPFVSLHCLMTGGADQEPDAKTRRNWLYLLNGSILISVFFVVRVVAIPFYYHIAVAFWQQWQSPLWLKALFVLFSLVGDSLNAIWFVGIMKGAAKTARQVFCDDADGAVAETDTKKDV